MTNYNSLSEEEEQIKSVQKNPYKIRYIYNPSEAVQLVAVQKNVFAIQHINKPIELVQLTAVKLQGLVLYYIDSPSEAVQLAAVKQNYYSISYIENPSEAIIKYILYECDISKPNVLRHLYSKLTSDEDKIYFNLKYGSHFD